MHDFDEYLQQELNNAKRLANEKFNAGGHFWICIYCGLKFKRQVDWVLHQYQCSKKKK
jgi:hypothetical protein